MNGLGKWNIGLKWGQDLQNNMVQPYWEFQGVQYFHPTDYLYAMQVTLKSNLSMVDNIIGQTSP